MQSRIDIQKRLQEEMQEVMNIPGIETAWVQAAGQGKYRKMCQMKGPGKHCPSSFGWTVLAGVAHDISLFRAIYDQLELSLSPVRSHHE